jgi:acetyl esterase/lipase
MGTGLGPDVLTACRALFDAEQRAGLWRPVPAISPMARMKGTGWIFGVGRALKPVLLFVHGGGFVLGDKGGRSPVTGPMPLSA